MLFREDSALPGSSVGNSAASVPLPQSFLPDGHEPRVVCSLSTGLLQLSLWDTECHDLLSTCYFPATSYAHSKPKAWLPQVALPKTEQAFARNNKKQEGPCKELW